MALSNFGGFYRELEGWPRLVHGRDGSLSGERKFRVKAAERKDFVTQLKGVPAREIAPDTFPGYDRLVCLSVEVLPMPGSKGDPDAFYPGGITPLKIHEMSAEWWHVTAKYELPLAVTYSESGEFLTLPLDAVEFQDGTKVDRQINIGKIIPAGELTLKRQGVPSLYPNRILRAEGTINASTFNPLAEENRWRRSVGLPEALKDSELRQSDHAPGTVLFNSHQATMISDPLGGVAWEVEFHFLIRPDYAPWNLFVNPKLLRASTSASAIWQQIYHRVAESGPGDRELIEPFQFSNFSDFLV